MSGMVWQVWNSGVHWYAARYVGRNQGTCGPFATREAALAWAETGKGAPEKKESTDAPKD